METLTIQYDGEVYRAFETKRKQLYLGSSNSLGGLFKLIMDHFQKSSLTNKSTPTNRPVIKLSVCGNRVTATCEGQGVTVDEDYSSNRYHNIKHALELIERQCFYPKVGDPYYYVYFGESFRTGGDGEVRESVFRQGQIDFIYNCQQLPPNVYHTQEQAANVLHHVANLFEDLRGKW